MENNCYCVKAFSGPARRSEDLWSANLMEANEICRKEQSAGGEEWEWECLAFRMDTH